MRATRLALEQAEAEKAAKRVRDKAHRARKAAQLKQQRRLDHLPHPTQAHALTCSKARGSFGHHFRRLDAGVSRGARARRSVCAAASMTSYVSSREEAM